MVGPEVRAEGRGQGVGRACRLEVGAAEGVARAAAARATVARDAVRAAADGVGADGAALTAAGTMQGGGVPLGQWQRLHSRGRRSGRTPPAS